MTVDVKIDSRIAKCEKILETDPGSQIFAALADAYRKKGDLEKAFQVCQNGLRLHADYGAAHVVMAKINLDRGLYDWAEAELARARELDGNNRNIELLLAEIQLYKGDYKSAIKQLRKLSMVDPGNQNVQRLLEIAERIPREQEKEIGPPVVERPPEPEPIRPQPKAPTKPDRLSPREVLAGARSIDRVAGALYLNEEGLVMEAEWELTVDPAVSGAAMAEVKKFLNQELMKASFGSVGTVLIETGTYVFYLIRAASGLFLIVGDATVNLGTLRMKMSELTDRVVSS